MYGPLEPQVACYCPPPSCHDLGKVCWPGPEPQGTPSHTFLPPNGSPSHHLGLENRDPTQNSGPDHAVGVPGPESQLLLHPFWSPEMPQCQFLATFRICAAPIASDLGPQGPLGPQGGPRGPLGAPRGPLGPPRGPLGQGPLGPWGPKNSLINPMWGLQCWD